MTTRATGTINLNQIQFEWGPWLDDQKATAPLPRRASLPSTSSDTATKLDARISSYLTTSRSSWPKRTIYPCRPTSMSSRRRCCPWQSDLQTQETPACLAAYRGILEITSYARSALSSHINTSAFVVPILPGHSFEVRDLQPRLQGVSTPCLSLIYSHTQLCTRIDSAMRGRQPDALTPGENSGDASILQTPQRGHRVRSVPSIQSGRRPRRRNHRASHARICRRVSEGSGRTQNLRGTSQGDQRQVAQKNVRMERELHPD